MLNKFDHCWRIFATGLSFALFGIGGLLLRIVVFPLIRLLIFEISLRIWFSRQVIRYAFLAFIWIMRSLGVLRFTITGLERLNRKGLLIVANHPTLIDTVFLIALTKSANCIVKSSLWNNPFTFGPVSSAGYLKNDDSVHLIDESIGSLKRGDNLIVFPEGTRTSEDGIVRLKRGFANIAIRGRRNITPVIIRCNPATLGKNTKWWQIPSRWVHFQIDIQEDLDISPFIEQTSNEVLAVRSLTHHLQDYFNKGNQNHALA